MALFEISTRGSKHQVDRFAKFRLSPNSIIGNTGEMNYDVMAE
jgi:hypothetical protein